MKQHVEIEYDGIETDRKFNELSNKVINECFLNENMDKLKLYVSITLTIPNVIKDINKKYRNIDKPTDVLSFPMFNREEIDDIKNGNSNVEEVLGDIIISIPKVRRQLEEGKTIWEAIFYGTKLTEERYNQIMRALKPGNVYVYR